MIPEDKPRTLSVKDYLIRKLAVKMRTAEETISAAIDHQFKYLKDSLYDNNSVEISGFGKLTFRLPAAIKELERMNKIKSILLSNELTKARIEKIKDIDEYIEYLQHKINSHGTSNESN